MKTSASALSVSFLASVFIHLVAVGVVSGLYVNNQKKIPDNEALSIIIEQISEEKTAKQKPKKKQEQPQPPKKEKEVKKQKPVKKIPKKVKPKKEVKKIKPKKAISKVKPKVDQVKPHKKDNAEPSKSSPEKKLKSNIISQKQQVTYKTLIASILAREKRYPKIARRRRQQGQGILRLTIASSGKVINKELIQSTGKTLLDKEILKMVDRAAPFPKFPGLIKEKSLTFQAPISFVLR